MATIKQRLERLEAGKLNNCTGCKDHNPARYYLEQLSPGIHASEFKPKPFICPVCYRIPTEQPGRDYYSEMIKLFNDL